jgi:rRNA-processing protein FCF1
VTRIEESTLGLRKNDKSRKPMRKIETSPGQKTLEVILDSSFLFTPSQFRIDIFEELDRILNRRFEPIVLSTTIIEMQRIKQHGSTKTQRKAALALTLAQRCTRIYAEKDIQESDDDVIVRVAAKRGCAVATNDRDLRKQLRIMNIPVIYLRQRTRLTVEGYL